MRNKIVQEYSGKHGLADDAHQHDIAVAEHISIDAIVAQPKDQNHRGPSVIVSRREGNSHTGRIEDPASGSYDECPANQVPQGACKEDSLIKRLRHRLLSLQKIQCGACLCAAKVVDFPRAGPNNCRDWRVPWYRLTCRLPGASEASL